MKKFFRLVSVLALAGLTLTYTSCTDYSEDIDKTNARVDDLENKLASVDEQVAKNKAAIEDLQKAKSEAEAAIKALQETVATLETKEDHKKDVDALKSTIEGIKGDVSDLDTRIKTIEDALPLYAEVSWVESTFATLENLKATNSTVAALDTRLTAAEGKINKLVENYDTDVKISEVLNKIKTAQSAAEAAQSTANDALGKVNALTAALGVYAKEGELAAKIAELESADSTLDVSIKNNYAEYKKFVDEEFEPAVKKLIADACDNGGTIDTAIATKVNAAKSELYGKIADVEAVINAKISALWGVFNGELRGLVFVPELYADGIEAVEYAYATINPYVKGQANDLTIGNVVLKNYAEYTVGNESKNVYPSVTVQYEMNPSSATVTNETPLVFLVKDVASVRTRTSQASDFDASFVKVENGNLYVGLKANNLYQKSIGSDKDTVTVFALQATVRAGEVDTTVTSDYARIYASTFSFDNIAFNDANKAYDAKGAEVCGHVSGDRHHIYSAINDALQDTAYVKLGFEAQLDLNDMFESHYTGVDTKGVYDASEFAASEPVSYEFDLVDYTVDGVDVSGTSLIKLENGVLSAVGNKAAIDRQPIVRVRAIVDGSTVLVGFVKVKITSDKYFAVDPAYQLEAKVGCNDVDVTVPADSMIRVYKALDFADEATFDVQYQLQTKDDVVVRYVLKTADVKDGFKVEENALGVVVESAAPSALTLKLTPADLSKIFQLEGGKYTTYVRYIRKTENAPANAYEGVYVPVTVTVTRDAAGTVVEKLPEYWFGENKEKAYLNVEVPGATPGAVLPGTWVTPINQVWDGNAPKFIVNDNPVEAKYYYYYFAPVQPKVVGEDGEEYNLSVRFNKIYDKFSRTGYVVESNDDIPAWEHKISADFGHRSSIYANTELLVNGDVIAVIVNYDENGEAKHTIEFKNIDLARKVLNATSSNPREKAGLFANIGVTLREKDCAVSVPLTGQINEYYFLRPINFEGSENNTFVDGVDATKPEANLNIFDAVTFTDWRGEKFVTDDYSNLWYFKYYGINKVSVDLANVTTNLNGGVLGTTKLSEKTIKIELTCNTGEFTAPVEKENGVIDIEFTTPADPSQWNASQYPFVVKKFGFIRYQNNGTNVSKEFKLSIPVKISYTWGDIEKDVIVTVEPTTQK